MPKRRRKAGTRAKQKTTGVASRAANAQGPATKRARFDLFDFSVGGADPIIENLREVSQTYKPNNSLDDEIIDQVALEGLTGLTFGRLCLILDAVIPNLNSAREEKVQDYIWSVIVNRCMRRIPGASIQVFHLKLPAKEDSIGKQRESSQNQSSSQSSSNMDQSSKNFIIDKQIRLPSHTLKRIAKSDWMLNPVQDGAIMGSCEHYLARTNITQQILDMFDSEGARGSLHELNRKFNLDHVYLVADQELRRRMLLPPSFDPNMELKLREFACLELIGRTRCLGIVFPNDKTLGRYRILLTAKGLITQYQQTCNSYIIHHIRRFSRYNLETAARPFKDGISNTRPAANPKLGDEDDDEICVDSGSTSIKTTCCHPKRLKSDRDMLKMVYDAIALSKGRSMLDIRRKLKIPKSHVRNHLKNLANIELIGSHTRIINEKKVRIYRARHPSSRRKTLLRQKTLTGVRAKWDEVDIKARELLGYRRSHFSQAEDSLLILCRITCLLLEPNLRKLSFCVPKQLIRDTLHTECYESHDKTSDALLRRTKFLRHLPQNIMMINELTAELRDDPDIMRLAGGRKDANSDEKLAKLFKQLLRAVRARLPHLLGLTSSLIPSGSGAGASKRAIQITSTADLKEKFRLVDCQQQGSGSGCIGTDGSGALGLTRRGRTDVPPPMPSSASLSSANLGNKSHLPPACSLVQLAQPLERELKLELADCKGMKSILHLASYCAASSFNIQLHLKVPIRVVGLDQDNESFKDIFERAKESKETSRLIANLTTPNPTADSRRALFMLRNALKLQTLDKCGKLADALIVQPCDIKFTAEEKIVFDGGHLLEEFTIQLNETVRAKAEATTSLEAPSRISRRTSKRCAAAKRKRTSAKCHLSQRDTASTSKAGDDSCEGTADAEAVDERPPITERQVLKCIEALLAWISVYPGIELDVLKAKMARHLICGDSDADPSRQAENAQLASLLDLMEKLQLISCTQLDLATLAKTECGGVAKRTARSAPQASLRVPRLFGYKQRLLGAPDADGRLIHTYEPQANAYIRYCQLINIDL